jgi:hypothetical protein
MFETFVDLPVEREAIIQCRGRTRYSWTTSWVLTRDAKQWGSGRFGARVRLGAGAASHCGAHL